MRADFPDKILVSIIDKTKGFSCDVELPSQMPAEKLRKGLLRLLQSYEPVKYAAYSFLELLFKNKTLKDKETLASLGAWDGSEFEIKVM